MGALDYWQDQAWRGFAVSLVCCSLPHYTDLENSSNVTVPHSPNRVDPNTLNILRGENLPPAQIDPSIDKWFFISGAAV